MLVLQKYPLMRKTKGSCPDQIVHHAIQTGATASYRRLSFAAFTEKSFEAKIYRKETKCQFRKDLESNGTIIPGLNTVLGT